MKIFKKLSSSLFVLLFLIQISMNLACAQDKKIEKKPVKKTTVVKKKAITAITGADKFDAAITAAGDTLVMVDLYADWCSPCRSLAPVLETVATENRSKVRTFKVNVDHNRDLAMRYKVRGIPYVVFLKNGKLVTSITGLHDKADYVKAINQYKAEPVKK